MSVTAKSEAEALGNPDATLEAIRAKLAAAPGRPFWRSLEDIAQSPAFQEAARREFPRLGSALASGEQNRAGQTGDQGVSRRAFLTVMGASLALAGLSGCGAQQPQEKIVPYIDEPNGSEPGKPLFYATAMARNGSAEGVLVTSREGRPIKIEGNPTHPASLGATDAIMQASLLSLYDPDRSQAVIHRGVPATWDDFVNAVTLQAQAEIATGGAGMRFLSGAITSVTLTEQMQALLTRYPNARWCQYEPIGRENARAGAQEAFGSDVNTIYHFERADVIVSLDGDFLLTLPGHVRYAVDFGKRRTARHGNVDLNRLYVAESAPTLTGAMAEHLLRVRPGQVEAIARALYSQISSVGSSSGNHGAGNISSDAERLSPTLQSWVAAVVRDLQEKRGRSVVVVGEAQPPIVHALTHAINQALGNVGQTVTFTEPLEASAGAQSQSLSQLVADLQRGQVQTLVMLDCNPVYMSPADLGFADALAKVPFVVHLGEYEDETANLSNWHVPQSHYLESWGDVRALDGTITVQQPLIAPLYDTHTVYELLAVVAGQLDRSDHDIIRDRWQRYYESSVVPQTSGSNVSAAPSSPDRTEAGTQATSTLQSSPNASQSLVQGAGDNLNTPARGRNSNPNASQDTVGDFDLFWRTLLTEGIVAGTAAPTRSLATAPTFNAGTATPRPEPTPAAALDLVFMPDPTIWDGRFANNGWLQELPKPLTKLTWDNAACLSPRTAQERHLADGDVVTLHCWGRQVDAPVLIVPGHPEGVVSVSLGYGRTRAGNVGTGAGFNAYALRTSEAPWFTSGLQLTKTDEKVELAITHSHHTMEGRDIVRAATIATFQRDPGFVHDRQNDPERPESLYSDYHYPEYAWAMSVDLTRCIGCNACVMACQSENNIAVVGRDQVLRGREMHWLRIDRYYEGKNLDTPSATYFMPVPCMMCEHAPCELVCPPGATLHNRDGLNQMVYNRCIGTRYCSNNCPYKVRRFNFLQYADLSPHKQLMRNPEVTVRSRGVMEKCTYCVQRIENAKITADKENRLVHDGEITTACAQACPTNAIVFGNLADRNSLVSQLKREPHDYGLLSELNTRPRTTYLGKVSDPGAAG